jgi:protein-tyrosine-phosphatase
MNILVLCTGNSARSILLESILNHTGGGRVTAYSAGSHPAGAVHPQSLTLLRQLGHNISDARSKSWDEFARVDAPRMDVVITVCSAAAGETCPLWPGAPIRTHWGIDDPADCIQDCEQAFQAAYDSLSRRASRLLALPLDGMGKMGLQAALDKIGQD